MPVSPKICVRRTSSSTSKKKWRRCWAVRFQNRTRRRTPDGRGHRTGHRRGHACRLPCAVCAARFLLSPTAFVDPSRSAQVAAFTGSCAFSGGMRNNLDASAGERFQDRSPAAVYATLLDDGEYFCSIRSMYRLLKRRGESRERRDQLTHPPYHKPELLAPAPKCR